MATMWHVVIGFWRLLVTPIAWPCYRKAVHTAKASNRLHCPSSPGRVGIRGRASLCWIVTSFWREDLSVAIVEKFTNEEGGVYWLRSADMGNWAETSVDYYTGVWTPAWVIPLPWCLLWFPLANERE